VPATTRLRALEPEVSQPLIHGRISDAFNRCVGGRCFER